MTRILSIEPARRYNVHDARKSVGRVKINILRALPIVPNMMNNINTTRVKYREISNKNMFCVYVLEVRFASYIFEN